MNEVARSKMIKARTELVLDHPFFATLALRLDMREDPGCRSAWSDGRVLAYNPAYIESMPLARIKGLQCHEVLHLACCHHTRRGGRDERLWNMACDYAINPVLLDAGLELPAGYLDDPDLRGRSADSIYASLVEREEKARAEAEGQGEEESESAEGAAGATRAGEEDPGDGASGRAETEDEPESAALGDDGEGAGEAGESSENEGGDADPGMSGEVRDASDGGGDGGNPGQEESWREALAQALGKSDECGELPGSLARLLGRLVAPPLDWRGLLRRFVEEAARNDFSWLRPNRRRLHDGLYLPGLENQELAEVAVAVDVSGSVTQAELDRFASELSALLEEFDTKLTVFTCDAALTREERLSRWDLPLDFQPTGGGGTDFRPPFARLDEDGACPACLIYFSDMECARFPEEPAYPVLWVTANAAHAAPPFGEVVIMEQEQ